MQCDDTVGVRVGEKALVEQVRRRRGQRRHARRVIGDLGARDQLAHMVKRPAVVRRGAPVGEGGSFFHAGTKLRFTRMRC